jgi:pimeloyl-ACP methyl ester carboxylesterase
LSRRQWVAGTLLWTVMAVGCGMLDANVAAERLAQTAGLKGELIATNSFVLTSFSRISDPNAAIDIYIEGDGHAWDSRYTPSVDPTPRHALALQLATRDPAANVVYLARPCQFTARDPRCETAYWTDKRYAPEVIDALDDAIGQVAARAPGQPLNLIGYSGGGALAVLVAARRRDVASLRTVAANLDLDEFTRLHHVSPLTGSRNPIDAASRISRIPQIHFSGADDRIVPPSVARHFATAVRSSCVRTEILPGLGHEGDWARIWPQLLRESVDCDVFSENP